VIGYVFVERIFEFFNQNPNDRLLGRENFAEHLTACPQVGPGDIVLDLGPGPGFHHDLQGAIG
jgi:hypothetical protein